MSSGSRTFTTSNPNIEGRLQWSISGNGSTANSSDVTVQVHFRRTNTGFTSFGTINTRVRVHTQTINENNVSITMSNPTIWSQAFNRTFRNVAHNSNGSLTAPIRADGSSNFGLSFDFTREVTFPTIPRHATITSVSATNMTHNSIGISWATDVACDRADLEVRSGMLSPFTWTRIARVDSINTRSGTVTATNLQEDREGHYRVVVRRRDSGLTTASSTVAARTIWESPTVTASTVSTGIDSITLDWSSSHDCDLVEVFNGGTRMFSQSFASNTTSGRIAMTSSNALVEILPRTSYTLFVRVRRRQGQVTAESSTFTATTSSTPTISDATTRSFNIGSSITAHIINASLSAFSIQLRARGTAAAAWVTIHNQNVAIGTNAVTFTPNANALLQLIPIFNTIECQILCTATVAGTTHTSTHSLIGHVVGSNPTLSDGWVLVSNSGTNINTIIGGSSDMILGFGNQRISFPANSASGNNHAAVARLEVTVSHGDLVLYVGNIPYQAGEFTYNIPIGTFTEVGTYTVGLVAIDSRGNRSARATRTFIMYQYRRPVIGVTLERLNNFEEDILMALLAEISRLTVGGTPRNSVTSLRYRFSEAGGAFGNWTTLTNATNTPIGNDDLRVTLNRNTAGNYFKSLDSNLSYNFQFTISDALFMSEVLNVFVAQGKPVLGVFDNGVVSIDKVPDFDNIAKLQIEGDVLARSSTGTDYLVADTLENLETEIENFSSGPKLGNSLPMAPGAARAGTSEAVSREDHRHPFPSQLATARNITVGNQMRSFNGTANISFSLSEIGAMPRAAFRVLSVPVPTTSVAAQAHTAVVDFETPPGYIVASAFWSPGTANSPFMIGRFSTAQSNFNLRNVGTTAASPSSVGRVRILCILDEVVS